MSPFILYNNLRASRMIHYLNWNFVYLISVNFTVKQNLIFSEAGVDMHYHLLWRSYKQVSFNFISCLESNKIPDGTGCTLTSTVKTLTIFLIWGIKLVLHFPWKSQTRNFIRSWIIAILSTVTQIKCENEAKIY